MNTLNKILKCYSDVYSPHRNMMSSIKADRKFGGIMISVYFAEIILMYFLLFIKQELWAFVVLIVYFISIAIFSNLHDKRIEQLYGSMENFDIQKIRKFQLLALEKTRVDLFNVNENMEVEGLISDEIERNRKVEQSKKTAYIALVSMAFPLLVKLFTIIMHSEIYLTLFFTLIGIVIMIYATIKFISAFYSRTYKLEQIRVIIKEIRLVELIDSRINKKDINTNIKNNEIIKVRNSVLRK